MDESFADDLLAATNRGNEETVQKNEHEGWFNYETWCLALWIDNEEGTYRWSRDSARECVHDNQTRDEAVEAFEAYLKDAYEDEMPELKDVWSDLLQSAFSEINWREIAESIVDEVIEERKEGQ